MPDPSTPRPIDRREGEPTFFDKRIDAMLSLVTGQGTANYRPDLHRRAIELYAGFEDPTRSYAEAWLLAIRALMLEQGVLRADEIDRRLQAMTDTAKR